MQRRLNIALIVITALLLSGGVMASAETAAPCPQATAVMERVWQVYDGITSFYSMAHSRSITIKANEVEEETTLVSVSRMELWFDYPRMRMDLTTETDMTEKEADAFQFAFTVVSGLQTGFSYMYHDGQWSKTETPPAGAEMDSGFGFFLTTDMYLYTALHEEVLAGQAVWVVEGEGLYDNPISEATWWIDQQTYFIVQMAIVQDLTLGDITTSVSTIIQWKEFTPHIAIPDEKFAVPEDVPLCEPFMPFDRPTDPFQAPEFRAVDTTGEEIALVDLRGKVVLLNFWASWCRPCIAKLPLIQQLYEQYAADGLVIIGINLDRSERTMERILEDFNITFRQIFEQAEEIADLYDVVGIPAMFLIDRQGVVRYLHLRHEDQLRAAIERLLAATETPIACPHATAVMERVWQVYDGITSLHGMAIFTTVLGGVAGVEGEGVPVRVSYIELWLDCPRIRMSKTEEAGRPQETSTMIRGLQTGFEYEYRDGEWSKREEPQAGMDLMERIFLLCADTLYTTLHEEILAERAVWAIKGELLLHGTTLEATWWIDQQTYFIAQITVVDAMPLGATATRTMQWKEFTPHIAIPDEKFTVPEDVPLREPRMRFDRPTAPFPAPEFRAVDIAGEEIVLVDLRGKVVLLNFWASWCLPCIDKLPLIQQLYQQYAADGLVIIGINRDRSERAMERVLEGFNITFRQIFEQAEEIADLYKVVGIPATFLIDRQGVVRYLHLRHEDQLRAAIERLLAEQ